MIFKGEERDFIGFKLQISDTIDVKQMENLNENNSPTIFYPPVPTPKQLGI